jgi:hypothetical protein
MTMLSGFVHVPSMDAVYWTLFVEMRFYFLVLIVLLFKQIHRAQHLLMFWLLISVLSEIFKIDILRQIFLSNNSHSAYFIAGATFYLIWAKEASIGRVALLIVSWLWGLFGVVGSASEFSNSYNVSHSPLIVFLIITLFPTQTVADFTVNPAFRSLIFNTTGSFSLALLHAFSTSMEILFSAFCASAFKGRQQTIAKAIFILFFMINKIQLITMQMYNKCNDYSYLF